MNPYILKRKRVTDISGNLTRCVVLRKGRKYLPKQWTAESNRDQVGWPDSPKNWENKTKGHRSYEPLIGKESHPYRAEHSLREKILIKLHAREVDETKETCKTQSVLVGRWLRRSEGLLFWQRTCVWFSGSRSGGSLTPVLGDPTPLTSEGIQTCLDDQKSTHVRVHKHTHTHTWGHLHVHSHVLHIVLNSDISLIV